MLYVWENVNIVILHISTPFYNFDREKEKVFVIGIAGAYLSYSPMIFFTEWLHTTYTISCIIDKLTIQKKVRAIKSRSLPIKVKNISI
jgi:predicted tellurium resistance membrane protein TerC